MDLAGSTRHAAARFSHDIGTFEAARELGVVLPDEIHRAVPKRLAEYVAGRWCALTAIRAIEPRFDGQIPTDDRAPRWPAGIVGSITHTAHFAWAVVAPSAQLRSVGIDAESLPSPDGVDAIRSVATSPDDAPPKIDRIDEATHYALLFSAKESLFKCLHPLVRRMFWYEDAGLSFDHDAGRFHAVLRIDLDAEFRRGVELTGSYFVTAGRVHTAMFLPRG
jgi:enterobactin synthetase component D